MKIKASNILTETMPATHLTTPPFINKIKTQKKQRQKRYWQLVIKHIEMNVKNHTKRHLIKNNNYYSTLPAKLRQRVEKIIPLDYVDEYPAPGYQHPNAAPVSDFDDDHHQHEEFNESTNSLVERKEEEFPKFDLHLEIGKDRETEKKRYNWYTNFICAPRRDRVKWNSKIYTMEKNVYERPLDEQAEEIMEASAENFTQWINNLGSKTEIGMTKDQLKSLFSIESNKHLLASIQTDPKEVKAIAKTVADRWNLPEMAIELKYENCIMSDYKAAPKTTRTVAFGKTIPYKDRPWTDPDEEHVSFETVYPEVLSSGEHLFKGIGHLRSTKALIEYCNRSPNITKPKYLVENGYFIETARKASVGLQIPLYALLKLK